MSKRIEYIDNAKALLILMMVFGHVFLTGYVRQFIYVFHMPAFFIISGILLNKSSFFSKSYLEILKSRAYSLIIPYIFFEFLGVLTDIFRNGISLNLKGYIYNSLTLNCNNGPDWFLFVLFVIEIVVIFSKKLFKKDYVIVPFASILGILFIYNPNIFPCAGQCGIGLLFFLLGYYLFKLFTTNDSILLVASFVVTFIIALTNGYVSIAEWQFGNVGLYIWGAIAGTYFTINICQHVHSRPISYIGKNTLIILGTHNMILLPLRTYIMPNFTLAFSIFTFSLIILLEYAIIYIFNKYIPFLVGKKRS